MPFFISSWNLNPNRLWFVRLADSGSAISVELYLTEADAEARSNLQAEGSSQGYGENLEVYLVSEESTSVQISLFQDFLTWHLKVSGSSGDPSKIFKIREFVELDEVSHPIFRNTGLSLIRAKAEIDAHTHARYNRAVQLGTHLPGINAGDICSLSSVTRGISELGQIVRRQIAGTPDSLVDTLEIASFKALKR